jgi:hypothetical protein
MECKGVQEKLSAYIEGDVSSDEKRRIEQHVNSCQKCRTALEDLKNTGDLVRGLEEVEPPAWLTEKIIARVRAEEGRKRGIFRKLFYPLHVKVPVEALATVLIAVVAVYVFRAAEPEMKRAQLHLPTGPAISREEAPRPYREPEAEVQVLGGKTSIKEQKEKLVQPPLAGSAEGPLSARKKDSPAIVQPASREPERVGFADVAKDKRERNKLAAAPMVKESAVKKSGPIDVRMTAKDIKVAGEEVEKLLGQLGAGKIERESHEGKEVLTAELKGQKRKEFLERLRAIGEVKEKGRALDIPEGDIPLRIEIVSNP